MLDPSCGIVYIAIGEKAKQFAERSIEALRRCNDFEVTIFTEKHCDVQDAFQTSKEISRSLKTRLYDLSPYDYTLYIDADTFPDGDVSPGFETLAGGWDMAIIYSSSQGPEMMWHIGKTERELTAELYGFRPLQLQGGVMYFKRNERVENFFTTWHREWLIWKEEDQAALLRALYKSPLKYWMLGRPFNGGAVIRHTFARMDGD